MSVEDARHYIAIQELLTRYAHALDDRDFARLNEVFASEAVFGEEPGVVGVDMIIRYIERLLRRCGESQHLVGSVSIELHSGWASTRSAVRAFHRGAGDRSDLVYELLGDYCDVVVLTEDGWRIRTRVLRPRSRIGNRDLVLGLDR